MTGHGYVISARRDWTILAPPAGGLPGIEIRYVGIGGTGDFAWVEIELRQVTP
jgi:hypothetical protein